MQVFTADRKTYQMNELKSWAGRAALSSLFYFSFRLFTPISHNNIFFMAALYFFLKLGDTLTQYHVKEIQIDKENDKLNLILSSLMSGKKKRSYDLRQITALLTQYKPWTGFNASINLKIYLPKNEIFNISSRYGFTTATLAAINNELSVSDKSIMT